MKIKKKHLMWGAAILGGFYLYRRHTSPSLNAAHVLELNAQAAASGGQPQVAVDSLRAQAASIRSQVGIVEILKGV